MSEVPATAPKEAIEKDAEVKLVDARLPNSVGGRVFSYDLQVVAKVGEKNKAKVAELFQEKDAGPRSNPRYCRWGSDPASLAEPGLERFAVRSVTRSNRTSARTS